AIGSRFSGRSHGRDVQVESEGCFTRRPNRMGIAVKIKLVAVIVFVLVGLGATAYAMGAFASGGTSDAQYLTAAVTRGTVTQAAAATGTVATTASYGLAFGLPARLIEGSSTGASSSTTWHVKS